MDVQQVVKLAKNYVHAIYADEQITNVGLEEIKLDPGRDAWRITIGFSRPWDTPKGFLPPAPINAARSLKLLVIDDKSGEVLSMETRETKQFVR